MLKRGLPAFACAVILALGIAALPVSASQGPSECRKIYCFDTPLGTVCLSVPWPCPTPEPCPDWLPWCEWEPCPDWLCPSGPAPWEPE